MAKWGQQILHLCSYLLCEADGACDTLEPHPERWSWPHPRSLQWPPLPATDEKSSSAATAPAPASASYSGWHSRRGCRPSPGGKLAVLGRVPTGKSADLTQLRQNPPANNMRKGSTTKAPSQRHSWALRTRHADVQARTTSLAKGKDEGNLHQLQI